MSTAINYQWALDCLPDLLLFVLYFKGRMHCLGKKTWNYLALFLVVILVLKNKMLLRIAIILERSGLILQQIDVFKKLFCGGMQLKYCLSCVTVTTLLCNCDWCGETGVKEWCFIDIWRLVYILYFDFTAISRSNKCL